MLNSVLRKAVAQIMAQTSPGQYNVTAKFFSSADGSKWSFFPFIIENLVINRDYLGNYADEIDLSMTISPSDYAQMQDQGQNLLCLLTLTYMDKFGKLLSTPAPVQKQYVVLMNDPRDARTAIPDIQRLREPSLRVNVRLVEQAIYNLRHTKISTIYPNMTVTQAIYAITQTLGLERIHLVPLNNTHKFDHIDVSEYPGIATVFGYLHDKYGLYFKGSNSYVTDGVLYIYPPFETRPDYDKTVSFYQIDTGSYAGVDSYHQIKDTSLSVVINTQPQSYDLSTSGSENIGTGFVFTRASRSLDGYTTIDPQQGAQYTENPAYALNLSTSRSVVRNSNNMFRVKSTDNPFPAMSRIIMHQASLMHVAWPNADPFQIDPGHAVAYYYDDQEIMVKKTGIVESAKYTLVRGQKAGQKDVFGATAELMLRLSPNTDKMY